jgi:hypothetical protein
MKRAKQPSARVKRITLPQPKTRRPDKLPRLPKLPELPELTEDDEVSPAFREEELLRALQIRRDRLGVVPWRPSLAIFRPRLWFSLQKHLLDGTLEALAASLTISAALQNLFDNRRQLEDRVVFALMRNPALPNACFTDALIEGLYDTVLNPALPLFLMEHPEQLERIELMLTWLVGAMAVSCPTIPGQAIVRDWTAAVAMTLGKRSARGKGRRKQQRFLGLVEPPLAVDEHDWYLTLTDEPWLDAEFLPGFVMHLARRHPQPSAAAMALAMRLRPLRRRSISPGSPEEIDLFIDRMDELLGAPRLTDTPPAPPFPEQLELALAKTG